MKGLWGPRKPRWTVELLDADGNLLYPLTSVKDHLIEIAALERLGGNASLTLDDVGEDIDWMSHRVRFVYDPGVTGVDPWPLGVFLLSSPEETWVGGKAAWQVGLFTKLAVIDEDSLDAPLSLPSGTFVIPTVVELIRSTGETMIAATDAGAVLSSTMVFDGGESKLTVINKLLQAVGYWSLKVDTWGVFQVQPWSRPSERAVAWEFHAGELSLHKSGWKRGQNLASVPNKVIARTAGTDEEPAFVGVAVNQDPASPFSYEARGRWVTRTYDVEAVNVASAQAQAEQRLLLAMDPVLKVDIAHALVPLEANAVVSFQPAGALESRLYTVQRMSIPRGFDSHVSASWRGVTGGEIGEGSLDDGEAI